MDLLMPVMDGIEATRQITAHQPQIRVVAMTSFIWAEKIIPAIRAGATGYVMNESGPGELIRSIYKVYRDEPAVDPGIAQEMVGDVSEQLVIQDVAVHAYGGP